MRWLLFTLVGLGLWAFLLLLAYCVCTAARHRDEAAERARVERWR